MTDGETTFVSHSVGDDQSWVRALRVYYFSTQPEHYPEDNPDFNVPPSVGVLRTADSSSKCEIM